jgi:TP901 family phage tail tape measure protein
MAFERMGLGGRLTFEESQAVAALKHASQTFDVLVRSANRGDQAVSRFGQRFRQSAAQVTAGAQQMRAGFGDVGTGVRNMAIGMTPVAAAMGFGIAKAADFEQKMSGVGAITRASAEDLRMLTAEAQRQGIVSVFSASESAEAMEFMGRAGFSTREIIEGLGGVMAAAAAEGVDLATSADIVARVVRGMGLEAKDAAHSADILALTSAKTNTNLIALGESFKFGAPQAKAMGISVEETAAIFGKLADAGLRGSIGGTAFTNMMVKLSKPSKTAAKLMDQWGIKLTDTTGALLPMGNIVDQFSGKLNGIRDTTEKAQMMTELFGIRGAKAYNALALAGGKAISDLTEQLEASSFGVGAAQEAADTRLNNFLGSFKLFGSSLEAASIEFFGPMMNSFKEATQDMTGSLNNVLFSIQGIKRAQQAQATAAERFAKSEAQGFAERAMLLDGLGKRQQSQAKAALHAMATEAIGVEKLSRAERLSRNKAFAQFVKENLAHEKMSKAARGAELGRLDALITAADEGRLTAADEANVRKRFFESLVSQNKTIGDLSRDEQQREAAKLRRLLTQEAAQKRITVEARALLERENELSQIEAKHGRTARLIAAGVMDALASIKAGFAGVVEMIKGFGERLREAVGEERLRGFVKLGTTLAVVGGALVPVAAGLGLFSLLLKGAMGPILGVGKMLWGVKAALGGVFRMIGLVGPGLSILKTQFLALGVVQNTLVPAFARIRLAGVGAANGIKGAFASALAPIARFGTAANTVVLNAMRSVGGAVAATAASVKASVLGAATATKTAVLAPFSAMRRAGAAALGGLKAIAMNAAATARTVAASTAAGLRSATLGAVGAMRSATIGALTSMRAAGAAALGGLKASAVGTFATMRAASVAALGGLKASAVGAFATMRGGGVAALGGLKASAVGAFATMRTALGGLKASAVGTFATMRAASVAALGGLKASAVGAFATMRGGGVAALGGLKTTVLATAAAVKGALVSAAAGVKAITLGAVASTRSAAVGALTSMRAAGAAALGGIRSAALGVLAPIRGAAIGAASALHGAFLAPLATIKAAAIATGGALKTAMLGGLGALKGAAIATGGMLKTMLVAPLVAAKAAAVGTGAALKTAFLAPLGAIKTVVIGAAVAIKGGLVVALAAAKGGVIAMGAALKTALLPVLAPLAPFLIPLVVLGGAVAGAFFLIRNEGESVGETLSRVWGGIVEGAQKMWADFKGLLAGFRQDFRLIGEGLREAFGGPVSAAGEKIGGFLSKVVTWFVALPGRIGGALSEFATVVGTMVRGAVSSALQWLNTVAPGVVEAIGAVADKIGAFLAPMFDTIRGWVSGVADWIGEKLRGPWESLKTHVGMVVDWIKSLLDTKLGRGLTSLMARIGNVLTSPFRLLLKGVLAVVDAVPGASKLVSSELLASVRAFAEHGFKPMKVKLSPEEQARDRRRIAAKGLLEKGTALADVKDLGLRREAVRQIIEGLGEQFSGEQMRKALRERGGNLGDVRIARAMFRDRLPATEQQTAERQARTRSLDTFIDRGQRQNEVLRIVEGLAKMGRTQDVQKVITARGGTGEDVLFAKQILEQRAEMRKEQMALQRKAAEDRELKANVEIQDSRSIKIDNKMCVDGQTVAGAMARHQQSITERSGGKATPFMRRRMVESGVKVAATAQG